MMQATSIFTQTKYRVHRLLSHKTFRNTSWMLLGYGGRIILQAVSYICLARILAPEGFGAFTAAQALGSFIGPFIELGTYSLIVRDIVGGVQTHRAVGNSMVLALVAMPIGLLILPILCHTLVIGVSWKISVVVGASVIISQGFTTIIKATHIAHGLLRRNSFLEISSGLLQLGLVFLLYLIHGGIKEWAWLYFIQNFIMASSFLLLIIRKWGIPRWSFKEIKERLRLGLHFAIGKAASNAYTDLDKSMLARLSTLESTGIYSAANRIIAIAFLPLIAFLESIYPRFFGKEGNSLKSARNLAWRLTPFITIYAILGCAGLYVTAPYLSSVLGDGYRESESALRWMSLLLFVKGIQYPFADAFSGSGYQSVRSSGQIGALVINLLLNIWLIPHYGWVGAIWASLVTQGGFLLFLVIFPYLQRMLSKSRENKNELSEGGPM